MANKSRHEFRPLMDTSIDESVEIKVPNLRVDLPPRPAHPPIPPRPTSVSPRPRPKREQNQYSGSAVENVARAPAVPPRPNSKSSTSTPPGAPGGISNVIVPRETKLSVTREASTPQAKSPPNLLTFSPDVTFDDFDPLKPESSYSSRFHRVEMRAPLVSYNGSAAARRLSDLMAFDSPSSKGSFDEMLEFDPLLSKPSTHNTPTREIVTDEEINGGNGYTQPSEEEQEQHLDEIQDPFSVASLTLLAQCRRPPVPPRAPTVKRTVSEPTQSPSRSTGSHGATSPRRRKVIEKKTLISLLRGESVVDKETAAFCDMVDTECEFLGAIMDSRLTIKHHIKKVEKKVKTRTKTLAKITGSHSKPRADTKLSLQIMKSMVQPVTIYAPSLMCMAKEHQLTKIDQTLRNAARLALHAPQGTRNELKTSSPVDDVTLNSGRVLAPRMERQILLQMTVKLIVETKLSLEPFIFTCDISTGVAHVVSHVVCSLHDGASSSHVNVDDYTLQVYGVSEYLERDVSIGDYEYVQTCMKLDRDIRFTLVDLKREPRPLVRTPQDREERMDVPSMETFKVPPIITRDNLTILLETYVSEEERLLDAAMKNEFRSLQPKGLMQSVKAICMILCKVETMRIHVAAKRLQNIAEKGFSSTTGTSPSGYSTSLVMACSSYDTTVAILDELSSAITELVVMYSQAFCTDFMVKQPQDTDEPVTDISRILDSVVVHISTAHRFPIEWATGYEYFRVSCGLFYGGRRLCPQVVTAQTRIDQSGFQHKIIWDEWVQFPSAAICTLPRETRLTVTVLGFKLEKASGEDIAKQVKEPLGWAVLPLFDYEGHLAQGAHLLAMWPDEYANPSGSSQGNIFSQDCLLLQVNLPDLGCPVIFPDVLKSPSPNHKRPFDTLHPYDQEERLDILEKDCISFCSQEENEMLWEKRYYLCELPEALPRVLLAAPSWDYACLTEIYNMVSEWRDLEPSQALELLLPCYADNLVRSSAVRWIGKMTSDQIHDYLPQLVQGLKYDQHCNSPLAQFLLEEAMRSTRVAHKLYWLLKEAGSDPQYSWRFHLMARGLLAVIGRNFNLELTKQETLVTSLTRVADRVKQAKDKETTLVRELGEVYDQLADQTIRLPHNCALEVRGIDMKSCSFFASNTFPLKLAFKNSHFKADPVGVMFKAGDDLRQDMLTLQFIHIMNKLWLKEGLDLKMIEFQCLPTGNKRGFVQLVTECETLRKIQVQYGLTGSFKDRPIKEWLQKYNPTELDYRRAVQNFTRSCAGCCVATYILGICDRHNDNIMLKQSGHMFHIDFGKFLGDSQMFGAIKRDRVPFVLTSDMAYVINGGDKPTSKFQEFIDLCCAAFNIIRKHDNFFLNLIRLMSASGIPGVNHDAALYIQKALMPECSDTEATAAFTRMIEESLKSLSTQINFFIHNLAQLRFSSHNDGNLLSFIPKTYNVEMDGRISRVEIVGYQKRYIPEKFYLYIIRVEREKENVEAFILRTYVEFSELYKKLVTTFPLMRIPHLPGRIMIGRSNVKVVAEKRRVELNRFLTDLLRLAPEISQCDLVYTFLHPILRDGEGVDPTQQKMHPQPPEPPSQATIGGALKVGLVYRDEELKIMLMHAKDLSLVGGQAPDSYVKTYLLPDPYKDTKRKSRIVKASQHPTFNELLTYHLPLEDIRQRRLQVSMWNYDVLKENELMGAFCVELAETDLSRERDTWFRLGPMQIGFR